MCLPACAADDDCPAGTRATCSDGACVPGVCAALGTDGCGWDSGVIADPWLDLGGPFTVELWVLPDAESGGVLWSAATGGDTLVALERDDDGATRAVVFGAAGASDTAVPAGSWSHLALGWTPDRGAELWLNGSLVSAFASPADDDLLARAAERGTRARLGGCQHGSFGHVRVSQERVYSEAFTPTTGLRIDFRTAGLWHPTDPLAPLVSVAGEAPDLVAVGGVETVAGPDGACPECTPDCGGAPCGDDGCGGSCGVCPEGEGCLSDRTCAACVPNCTHGCGPDGCGGSCGACPIEESCFGHPDGTRCPSDGDPCTVDVCQAGGCEHRPDPSCGGLGGSCEGGCDEGLVCAVRADACWTPCADDPCAAGDVCRQVAGSDPVCVPACDADDVCRPGQECVDGGCDVVMCYGWDTRECGWVHASAGVFDLLTYADDPGASTAEIWFRVQELPEVSTPIVAIDVPAGESGEKAVGASPEWAVWLEPDGSVRFALAARDFIPPIVLTSFDRVELDAWTHVAITDVAGDASALWLDGHLQETGSAGTVGLIAMVGRLGVAVEWGLGGTETACLDGDIGPFAVHWAARYSEEFTPRPWPVDDEHTALLLVPAPLPLVVGRAELDGDAVPSDSGPGGACSGCREGDCIGSCGDCDIGEICGATGACEMCVPDCFGRVCGDDGCGGVCGACDPPASCGAAGLCDGPCVPQCGGDGVDERVCGDDLCGGSCGECEGTDTCGDGGTCEPCVPSCPEAICAPDGCGGVCAATCGGGEACIGVLPAGDAVCTDFCDHRSTAFCDDGAACLPSAEGEIAVCAPLGDGGPGDACDDLRDCGPRLLCVAFEEGEPRRCIPLCDTRDPACAGASRCGGIHRGAAIGVCVPCEPICDGRSVSSLCVPEGEPTRLFGCSEARRCTWERGGYEVCITDSLSCRTHAIAGCEATVSIVPECRLDSFRCEGLCEPGTARCIDAAHEFRCGEGGDRWGEIARCADVLPAGASGTCIDGPGCVPEGFCAIDGVLHEAGDAVPDDVCAVCDPDRDPVEWSNADDGIVCGPAGECGETDFCEAGVCIDGCAPRHCANPEDRATLSEIELAAVLVACADCPSETPCLVECIETETSLSPDCSGCLGAALFGCMLPGCVFECIVRRDPDRCLDCFRSRCNRSFFECSGVEI